MLSLPERVVLHAVREPCHPTVSPAAPQCPPAPQSTTHLNGGCCERAKGSQGSYRCSALLALRLPRTSKSCGGADGPRRWWRRCW